MPLELAISKSVLQLQVGSTGGVFKTTLIF